MHWFGGAVCVISAGQVIVHPPPPVPFTVTVKEQESGLPWLSVVSQLTVVVPTGKLEPDGGSHLAPGTGQLSFRVGGG